mmetsp:Transcript_30833/g.52702  ORF Transcript_30833/g.52702 Transcript_30833/m.52702 type:complete len:212 (+) Transcript_30833:392-1027(+)
MVETKDPLNISAMVVSSALARSDDSSFNDVAIDKMHLKAIQEVSPASQFGMSEEPTPDASVTLSARAAAAFQFPWPSMESLSEDDDSFTSSVVAAFNSSLCADMTACKMPSRLLADIVAKSLAAPAIKVMVDEPSLSVCPVIVSSKYTSSKHEDTNRFKTSRDRNALHSCVLDMIEPDMCGSALSCESRAEVTPRDDGALPPRPLEFACSR